MKVLLDENMSDPRLPRGFGLSELPTRDRIHVLKQWR